MDSKMDGPHSLDSSGAHLAPKASTLTVLKTYPKKALKMKPARDFKWSPLPPSPWIFLAPTLASKAPTLTPSAPMVTQMVAFWVPKRRSKNETSGLHFLLCKASKSLSIEQITQWL